MSHVKKNQLLCNSGIDRGDLASIKGILIWILAVQTINDKGLA